MITLIIGYILGYCTPILVTKIKSLVAKKETPLAAITTVPVQPTTDTNTPK